MTIRGLVFDFDGLILETEEPIYRSWQETYREFDCELSFDDWSQIIGTADTTWDPLDVLEQQVGANRCVRPWPGRDEVLRRQHARESELILTQPLLPGVEAYLQAAQRLGLKVGLASSSPRSWVEGHLSRLGLRRYFEVIRVSEDVPRTKPDPALYLSALEGLGVAAEQAVAFEDSPNGILAARRAKMWCVAVPSILTRRLPIEHADLRLESLAAASLEDVLHHINARL